ncbi:hypothetical protein SAMN02745116_00432 [Pilibacter termitis]|jgi:hypothetical protein|uniref:Phage-Barnase-EndoU-ColicinE5/D-RelE like nuclease 4 domain-containing protein n=1 Tax=Pilibacter termitis TaxID=263852 RepID=A0A1T4KWI0_9ENTE|nr:PBECR4 domain-containing protein [Pilibacter termitis]SJZ46784.1 hypothetical protein SAMN02745116_00432 [Pilibacter termitis]
MAQKRGYRAVSYTEYSRLRNYSERIYDVAKFFQDNFFNKRIFIATADRKIELFVKKENILHLLGIDYRLGTQQFWRDIKRHELQLNSIRLKDDGTTFKKLGALQHLPRLFQGVSELTEGKNFKYLKFDSSIRTPEEDLALAFVFDEHRQSYVPNSTLNLKFIEIPKGQPILAVYTIDRATKELNTLKLNPEYSLEYSPNEVVLKKKESITKEPSNLKERIAQAKQAALKHNETIQQEKLGLYQQQETRDLER